MVALAQFKVVWSGTGINGPSFSTFYAVNPSGIPGASNGIAVFFTAIQAFLPVGTIVGVPNQGQVYDDLTGQLLGTWGGPTQSVATGTGTGGFGSAGGTSVRWGTSAILRRHLLVGRTFIVPLAGSAYNANGTVLGSARTAINTAAANLAATGALRIWSRPSAANPVGGSGTVVNGSIPTAQSVLRSRAH
jgi:hypothetical protein